MAETREFYRTDGTAYGIRCILCTNTESACAGINAECDDDDRRQLVSAAGRAFEAAIGVTWDENSDFREWNGGKYSHQKDMYGYEPGPGLGVVRVSTADVEDGERGEWEDVKISNLPADVREMVMSAISAGDSAWEQVAKEIEAR
jgi:hypothetical protein